MTDPESPSPGGPGRFPTTQWSVVLACGSTDPAAARAALDELTRDYWFALYACARRRGLSAPDAEDAVQDFVGEICERPWIAGADPARGRFRAFFLGAFTHHLAHRRERAGAAKRGGGKQPLPLDSAAADARYREAVASGESPERAFERAYVRELVDRARAALRGSEPSGARGALLTELGPHLGEPGAKLPLAEIARRLELTEGAVKVALFRLRRRLRDAIQAEVGRTLSPDERLEDEIRYLLSAL